MNKIFSTCLLALIATAGVWGQQQERCGTVEYVRESLEQNPELLQQYLEIQRYVREYQRTNNGAEAATVITIPVVVNVIYNTSAQNISDEQILTQIDVLNEDFRKLNIEIPNTPSEFAPVVADVQIAFCLARRDPSGNPTTGIRRRETDVEEFPKGNAMKSFATGGLDAWDRDKYLNIWVCKLEGGLLGFAPYPGTATAANDGVVCTYTAFGTIGTASFPFNKGRTATHEIGHWLNLIHIWGDDDCGDDEVADTPEHDSPNYGCEEHPHLSTCAGNPIEMTMNYMDYSNDSCMYMFSNGQKNRMRAIVDPGGFRESLATSDGCVPVNCISGNIAWEHNGDGVNTVTVDITGPDNQSGSTAVSGNYEVCVNMDGNFTITPSKPHANAAALLNGATAADVLLIQKHVANLELLSGPYKRIAADVNANNTISSQDASILSQAIKGNPAAIAAIPKSWRFVPANYVFPNPNSPWGYPQSISLYVDSEVTDQDFVGAKIGDVNGSANTALKPGSSPVTLRIQDTDLRAGETIEAVFYAANFSNMSAFQSALRFNSDVLRLEGVTAHSALPWTTESAFGLFRADEGEIRLLWTDLNPHSVNSKAALFSMRFTVLKDQYRLSETLRLDETEIPAVAYTGELEEQSVRLQFERDGIYPGVVITGRNGRGLSAGPNPFRNRLTVGFELAETQDVRLRLCDLNGRVITELNAAFTEGAHVETLQIPTGLAPGLYLLEYYSNQESQTLRVVKAAE